MAMNDFPSIHISPWLLMPLVFFLTTGFLLMVKRILFVIIKRLTQRTKTKIDDIFIEAADFPLTLLVVASAGALVERLLPLMFKVSETNYCAVGLKAVTIFAAIIFADRFLTILINAYQDRFELLRTT